MKILAVGDIVGKPGREYIYRNLNKIRDRYGIDFVIANGENAATSNGITPRYQQAGKPRSGRYHHGQSPLCHQELGSGS